MIKLLNISSSIFFLCSFGFKLQLSWIVRHHGISTNTKAQARGVSLQVGLLYPAKIACQYAKAKTNTFFVVVVTTYLKYQTQKQHCEQ